MKLRAIKQDKAYLTVDISGTLSRFHYFWLRDNCPACRSANGQKLHETNLLEPDVVPNEIEHSHDEIAIQWSDGFHAVYPVSFLSEWAYDNAQFNDRPKILWNRDIENQIVRHDYEAVRSNPVNLSRWLEDVAT